MKRIGSADGIVASRPARRKRWGDDAESWVLALMGVALGRAIAVGVLISLHLLAQAPLATDAPTNVLGIALLAGVIFSTDWMPWAYVRDQLPSSPYRKVRVKLGGASASTANTNAGARVDAR
jgi:hypothetical protein